MASLLPEGKQSFTGSDGLPLVGGKLYTYDAGTTTPRPTYSDAAGTTPNTNPVILDSRGEATIFWSGSYKVVLKDAADNTIWSQDNVTDQVGILSTSSGSSLVGFLQSGVGAVPRTAQEKMRERVSVLDFGADPSGSSDSSTAFLNAATVGKIVYAPAGTYKCQVLNLPSGTVIEGDGTSATIIKPLTDDSRCALGCDSGSSSAFIDNITLRDFKLLGNVAGAGFSEQKHLASFNGARNLLIENIHFVGFRGDGLYIGSGNLGGQERHNKNVVVRGCYFDGVNSDNRNGISVIDVDGIEIDGNTFENCSRSDMPGAIDFEPDAYDYHVIRNVRVTNNKIKNCNGNVAAIQIYMPAAVTAPADCFVISGNTIDGMPNGYAVLIGTNRGATYTAEGGVIANNKATNCFGTVNITGASNINVSDNVFSNFKNGGYVGYTSANSTVFNIKVNGNTFSTSLSGGDGRALAIGNANGVSFENNAFVNVGLTTGGGVCIDMLSGTSSREISIIDNRFKDESGTRTSHAIRQNAGHVTTDNANVMAKNLILGNINHSFAAWNTDDCGLSTNTFTSATAASKHPIGLTRTIINGASNATTTGSITTGTTALTVASGTNIRDGDQITIAGAGAAGAALTAIVASGGGTTAIVIDTAASTTVSGAAVTTPALPGSYTQGVLTTEKLTKQAGFSAWITQIFRPRNTTASALTETYYRKTDTSGFWSAWVKVTGV